MKFLFLLIVPIFSLKCSNCKHFVRDTKSNIVGFGKCKMFPKTNYIDSLDKKKELRREDMYYCSTARVYSHMCDTKGKYYEPN